MTFSLLLIFLKRFCTSLFFLFSWKSCEQYTYYKFTTLLYLIYEAASASTLSRTIIKYVSHRYCRFLILREYLVLNSTTEQFCIKLRSYTTANAEFFSFFQIVYICSKNKSKILSEY